MNHTLSFNKLALATVLLTMLAASLPAHAKPRHGGGLRAQLTQFDGGCPPNRCQDVQFSIHRAPVCPNGPSLGLNEYSAGMVREVSGRLAGGGSTLVRAEDALAFDLSTTGLRPNAPYTIWWVAFNPDNPCISGEDPCNCGVDSLRPGADSVFYATGAMSDRLGSANFAGRIDYGQVPDGFDQVPFGGQFGVGIQPGAEVHLVVRDHGRALRRGWRKANGKKAD